MKRELIDGEFDEDDIIYEYAVDKEDPVVSKDDHFEADTEMMAGDDPEYFVSSGDEVAADDRDDSVHLFTGHKGPILTVACNPTNATLVATGGEDELGFVWNIAQNDQPQELLGHTDSVTSLAFSFDGKLLASGSFDGLVQVWDMSSGNLKCKLAGPTKGIEWVRWHPRGHLVLAGSEDFTVWLWNADKAAYLNMFIGHEGSVTCGDFTPDGKRICTGSDDVSLRIWDPKSGNKLHIVKGHQFHTKPLRCLTVSYDSTRAITGSEDGSVRIVNITTGEVFSSLVSHQDSIECVGLSPSVPCFASGGLDNTLIIWDMRPTVPRHMCAHEVGVSCLQWLGASKYIATGCIDGTVLIWDCESGNCVKTLVGHTDNITSLSVTPNGEYLISGSMDGQVRVFEIAEIGKQDHRPF